MLALPQRLLARAAGRLWSRLSEGTDISGACIPILCYHFISDAPYAISPARFAAQMRWLRRRGYESVGLDALLDAGRTRSRRRSVVITFDDGLADLPGNALPELLACGFRATVFFSPALAGRTMWYSLRERAFVAAPHNGAKRLDFMSWEQAQSMAAVGVSFQSHAWSHPRLSALPEPEIAEQLSRSRHALESRLGEPVRFLSYPFGDFDCRVQHIAASLGYAAAVTTIPGFNSTRSDPYALRRVAPNPGDDLSSFAFKLSPVAGWCYRWAKHGRADAYVEPGLGMRGPGLRDNDRT